MGGSGGTGVAYIAAKKKTGSAPNIAGVHTTSKLYEITASGTLVEHTNWADTWDNT
jgi:hypothetical protein